MDPRNVIVGRYESESDAMVERRIIVGSEVRNKGIELAWHVRFTSVFEASS